MTGNASENPLSGKVALVTGGGRGIGRECALACAEAGASVAVAATTESEIRAVAEEIRGLGSESLAVQADVTSAEDTGRMARETAAALGGLDIAINAAGIGGPRLSFLENDPQTMLDITTVNVYGVLLSCQAELREMVKRGGGHIINISSGLAHRGVPLAVCYGSSKWAVEGITQGIVAEFKDKGVISHTIGPGRMITRNFPLSELTPDRYHEARPVKAIRGALLHLLTDPAGYPNGKYLSSVDFDRENGIEWKNPLIDA